MSEYFIAILLTLKNNWSNNVNDYTAGRIKIIYETLNSNLNVILNFACILNNNEHKKKIKTINCPIYIYLEFYAKTCSDMFQDDL
jgi:hypothetical protein